MKTQFKHHIKFGSCWYDSFFKVNKQQQQAINKIKKPKEGVQLTNTQKETP